MSTGKALHCEKVRGFPHDVFHSWSNHDLIHQKVARYEKRTLPKKSRKRSLPHEFQDFSGWTQFVDLFVGKYRNQQNYENEKNKKVRHGSVKICGFCRHLSHPSFLKFDFGCWPVLIGLIGPIRSFFRGRTFSDTCSVRTFFHFHNSAGSYSINSNFMTVLPQYKMCIHYLPTNLPSTLLHFRVKTW